MAKYYTTTNLHVEHIYSIDSTEGAWAVITKREFDILKEGFGLEETIKKCLQISSVTDGASCFNARVVHSITIDSIDFVDFDPFE